MTNALFPIMACRALTLRNEDFILAAVESGRLGPAFDIANRGSAARDLRIWPAGLRTLATPDQAAPLPNAEEVLDILFPKSRDRFRVSEVTIALTCTSSHLSNLGEARLIRVIKGNYITAASWVEAVSLRKFLLSREVQ